MAKKVIGLGIFALVIAGIALGVLYYMIVGSQSSFDLSLLEETPDDRFGFLVSELEEEVYQSALRNAGWVRPHPGPFVWGAMQETPDAEIDFSRTDTMVKYAQKYNTQILATLWPYAIWDQDAREDTATCQIDDIFANELSTKRCNPNDFDAYQNWVRSVVERYDGDGTDDMPDLTIPIKVWEVNNEVELRATDTNSLQFYVGTPEEYGLLLKMTHQAIRQSDEGALVVLSGAAGSSDEFLSFYESLFADEMIGQYFDIANVHTVSSFEYQNLNVRPYKKILSAANLIKPIWVTEAETIISDNAQVNLSQLYLSTTEAIKHGAQKVFYTMLDLDEIAENTRVEEASRSVQVIESLDPSNPVKSYRSIFLSAPALSDYTDQREILEERSF